MNLYEKILTIYPALIGYDFISGGIELVDSGDGAFIYRWEHDLPQPTQEELDAITGDFVLPVKIITKLQFVEWCESNDKISGLINLLDSDSMLKFKWDAATALEVDNPLVLGAAAVLGIDAQETFNDIG